VLYKPYKPYNRLLFANTHTWVGGINNYRWAIITAVNTHAMGKLIFGALRAIFCAYGV